VAAFGVFLLAYVLSQFFRSFLAVIAPELANELALSPADLGLVSGAWFAAFALAQFPVGWALDRIGPRRTVPVLMLAAAAGSALFASATAPWHCGLAMALIGLGCAPIYMGALYMFARTMPPARFALLASWLLAIGTSGNLLATTPLALAERAWGWRTTFQAIALFCLASAMLIALVVRDPPRATAPGAQRGAFADLAAVARTRALWPLFPLVLISYAIVASERGLWIGPYLADVHGLDPVARGNAALVMAIAMSVGAFVYGPLDQWLGTRKWVVVAGSVLTAAAFIALATHHGASVATATALLALVGAAGSTYGVLMAHGRQFIPEHLIGRGLTFLNFLFIGGISLMQGVSGRAVEQARAAGHAPAEIFAGLHMAFGLALIAATLIYLAARER